MRLNWGDTLVRSAEIAEAREREAWAQQPSARRVRKRGPRPPNVPGKDRHGKTFRDPVVTRNAVLLASVVGCKRAGELTGIDPTTISRWRARLEKQTGERFPRVRNRGNAGNGKLTLAKARELRERRSRGVSWGVLARIYKVSPRTARHVCDDKLYPEPRA